MGKVLFAVVCIVIGMFIGIFFGVAALALCVAASERDYLIEDNPCRGCFGAAMGDCDECPKVKKGSETVEQSETEQ